MPTRERGSKEMERASQDAELIAIFSNKRPAAVLGSSTEVIDELSANLGRYKLHNTKYDEVSGEPYGPVEWGKAGIAAIRENKNKRKKDLRRLAGLLWGKVHRIPEILKIAKANGIKVSSRTLRRYFQEDIAAKKSVPN